MKGESGAVGLIAVGLAGLAMVLALVTVDVARVVVVRAQLTAAADAAALAAAPVTFSAFGTSGDPAREAASVAATNGARLVECSCPVNRTWEPRTVTVTVAADADLHLLGRRVMRAVSSAEFQPTKLGGVPGTPISSNSDLPGRVRR